MRIPGIKGLTLRTQITIIVLGLVLIAVVVLYFLLEQRQHERVLSGYGATVVSTVQNRGARLQVYVEKLRKDVLFLSDTPPVQAIIRADKNRGMDPLDGDSITVWKSRLQSIFVAFLQANSDYFQVRYISVQDGELVRVSSSGGQATVTPERLLQKKGDRDYFKSATQLKSGEVYLSDVNLNREWGEVVKPQKQTIRAVVPVYDPDGLLFGLLVINMDVGQYFDEVMQSLPLGVVGYVANQHGDYLAHPDSTRTYGFDLAKRYRWQDDMPALEIQSPEQQLGRGASKEGVRAGSQQAAHQAIELQKLQGVDGVHFMSAGKVHFDPDQPSRYLSLIYGFPSSLIDEELAQFRKTVLFGVTGLALFIALLVFVSIKRMFEPLQYLTEGAYLIAEGHYDTKIPKQASGELGVFVGAFSGMLGRIRAREKEVLKLNETLQRSEQMANLIIDTAPQAILVVDGDGAIIRANDNAKVYFGYEQGELLGQQVEMLMHEKYRHHHEELREAYTENTAAPRLGRTVFALRKDGSEFPVEVALGPMRVDDQLHVIVSINDITQRKKAEEELRKTQTMVESILNSAGEGIYGLDVDGKTTFMNSAACHFLGYAREEMIGRSQHAVTHHSHSDGTPYSIDQCPIYSSFKDGIKRTVRDEVFWRKDGTSFQVEYTSTPIVDQGGEARGAVVVFHDVSEQVQLESQLQVAQKMEAVGELAAGIAHEINTPLQYVGDNVRFIQESFTDIESLIALYRQAVAKLPATDSSLKEEIGSLEESADLEFLRDDIPKAISQSLDGIGKASVIVQAMKEFSHPGSKELTPIDINRVLKNTAMVSKNEWKYVAELKLELAKELPHVISLPEINQVFLNMIVNASHAIRDKLGKASTEKGEIRVKTLQVNGDVEIHISDTGKGISQENRQKVFDPFFTTKEVGKGTGQGLSISYNIVVEQLGGSIDIESTQGVGTTFIVRLPIAPKSEQVLQLGEGI